MTRLEQALEALRDKADYPSPIAESLRHAGLISLDDAERILTEWWPTPPADAPYTKGFGEALREALIAKEMTLRELGRRTGISASNLSKWERGIVQPPQKVETLEKLATALGLDGAVKDAFMNAADLANGRIPRFGNANHTPPKESAPAPERPPFALAEAIAEYLTESGRPTDATLVWDAIEDWAKAAAPAPVDHGTIALDHVIERIKSLTDEEYCALYESTKRVASVPAPAREVPPVDDNRDGPDVPLMPPARVLSRLVDDEREREIRDTYAKGTAIDMVLPVQSERFRYLLSILDAARAERDMWRDEAGNSEEQRAEQYVECENAKAECARLWGERERLAELVLALKPWVTYISGLGSEARQLLTAAIAAAEGEDT